MQIFQQIHQHEIFLFPNCFRGVFWQVLSEKRLQGSLVWQGVSVPVFPPVPFLPDPGCSEAHGFKDTIPHRHQMGVVAQVWGLCLFCVQGKKLSHVKSDNARFHVSAACWVSLIFVLILLSVHTVNMKRRRYRKTEDSAQSLLYGELMIRRPILMSARREILSLELIPLRIALQRHEPGVNSQLQHVWAVMNSELQCTSSGCQHNSVWVSSHSLPLIPYSIHGVVKAVKEAGQEWCVLLKDTCYIFPSSLP